MAAKFEDIEIIDLDGNRTHAPDLYSPKLYEIYLNLSAEPSHLWRNYWRDVRDERRKKAAKEGKPSQWREIRIDHDVLIIRATFDELREGLFSELQTDIAAANTQYKDFIAEASKRYDQFMKQMEAEKKSIDDLKKSLKLGTKES